MKTQIFKNVMPLAIAALGIFGAFLTTSMQSVEKEMAIVDAYNLDPSGDCDEIIKQCDNQQRTVICRFEQQTLYAKDSNGNCVQTLWEPN